MELDYTLIGKRVARRRKMQKLTQEKLSEMIDSSASYISNIERSVSIPSTETIMKLALAMDTTPDEFLVGTAHPPDEGAWQAVAQLLRDMDPRQLELARSFLIWLREQNTGK